jgi:hypothetical protein
MLSGHARMCRSAPTGIREVMQVHFAEARRHPADSPDRSGSRAVALPRESEFAFTTLRGNHHRPSSRFVRKLYGHPDAVLARERIREAYRQVPTAPVPIRRRHNRRAKLVVAPATPQTSGS